MKELSNRYIIIPIINIITMIFIKNFLNIFNLEFMSWFYYFFYISNFIIMLIYIFSHFIGTLFNKNNRISKKIFMIIMIIFVLLISCFLVFYGTAFSKPTYLVKKNNEKMEAEVFYWDKLTTITYYRYINFFMRSYKNIDFETCTDTFNPFIDNIEYKEMTLKSLPHDLYRDIIEIIT